MADALTKTGRYQLVSELGRGSMGVVYEGFDPIIGRRVAIKTMLTEGLTSQEFQEYKARFQREAQSAGVLTHPNIVTVYDFGEDAGVLYLAMEYLEGKSLEKLVEEQGILPIETIIPMFEQVCSALDHAHRHEIVHRDVKPANIMILDTGIVKVTDFGIAKMMSMGMTQAGQVLGTPNYMSPEQVKGRQIDGRSDIFSLGIILYELVTGEKPFGGQNVTTVIYKIINQDPIPPRELDATIHPGLSYVVCKALAKSPDDRYQTCRELADNLKSFKSVGGQLAPGTTLVLKGPGLQSVDSEQVQAPGRSKAATASGGSGGAIAARQPQPGSVTAQVIGLATALRDLFRTPRPWMLPTLGALVFLIVLGVGSYFLFRGRPQQVKLAQPPPPVVQTAQPAIPPAQTAITPPGAPPAEAAQTPPALEAQSATPPEEVPAIKAKPVAVSKIGQLLVTSNISGATISVDGRNDPDWVTPYTIANLPSGTHQVVVSKEGYDNNQQSVTIEGGKTRSLNFSLSAPRGEVSIVTAPPGLEVSIDGKLIGRSPAHTSLLAGVHTYAIGPPGAETYQNTFKLSSGAFKIIKVSVNGEAASGIVDVRTIPPGATVLADGNPVAGQTPTSFRLTAGQHTLVISLPGGRPVQRTVDVTANGTVPVNVSLPRQ